MTETFETRLARVLAEVPAGSCRCDFSGVRILDDLHAVPSLLGGIPRGAGCTDPHFCCPRLNTIRDKLRYWDRTERPSDADFCASLRNRAGVSAKSDFGLISRGAIGNKTASVDDSPSRAIGNTRRVCRACGDPIPSWKRGDAKYCGKPACKMAGSRAKRRAA
jgi:hypothetical protein